VHIFKIKIVEKGAHLNFAIGAILNTYTTGHADRNFKACKLSQY